MCGNDLSTRPISESMSGRTWHRCDLYGIGADLGRFGDKRLGCVGGALLDSMERQRTLCVHRLAKDRNQAIQFGRFLANPAVTSRKCWTTAGRQTGQRAWPGGTCWRSRTPPSCISSPRGQQARLRQGREWRGSWPVPASGAGGGGGRRRDHWAGGLRRSEPYQRQGGGPQAAGGGGEGVAPLAAWRRGGRRTAGERGADHRGGGPGERYLRLVRPSAGVGYICCAVRRRIASWWAASRCRSSAPDGCIDRTTISVPPRGQRAERQATVALRFGTVTLQRLKTLAPREPPRIAGERGAVGGGCAGDRSSEGQEPVHWRLHDHTCRHLGGRGTPDRHLGTGCAGSSNRSSVR